MDFKNIRVWAEGDARIKCRQKNGHMEVTLQEIWENLEKDTGVNAKEGMKIECEIEEKLCYANPYMHVIWERLQQLGKKVIIVSDMYLPKTCIQRILDRAGYTGAEFIYLSNEYGENKARGDLFRHVIKDFYGVDVTKKVKFGNDISKKGCVVNRKINGFSIVHIGDNPHSDHKMAQVCGLDILPYQNVNKNVLLYRPMDLSFMVGGAYRGLVSNHLYNGINHFGMEYEYGYLYGGLFVVGYCHFIHEYYCMQRLDKVLFLSRDGDTLSKVYQKLYPEDSIEYVYWSRKAAVKLMADEDKHDYFRRFIYHKVNQNVTIKEILYAMELEILLPELSNWKQIWEKEEEKRQRESLCLAYRQLEKEEIGFYKKNRKWKKIKEKFSEKRLKKERERNFIDLRQSDYLTEKNGYLLRKFIEANWDKVQAVYATQQSAARKYYRQVLRDCKKVAAVDIGWAGSGALALSHLTQKVWNMECQITGIIAGTNTIHNAEPDASDPFLQDGRLVAYLYSGQMNRDLFKKHDPNKDYNVFWELLLSSPTPSFQGFYEGDCKEGKEHIYMDKLDITLAFGKYDYNQDGIREIQRGILDFAGQYQDHFKDFPYMFRISGRDAYAPMLVAASDEERYLKTIEKRFRLEMGVN